MAILKSSSMFYAGIVVLLTLGIIINDHALKNQTGHVQLIDLNNSVKGTVEEFEQEKRAIKDSGLFLQALNYSRQGKAERAISTYQTVLINHPNHQMAAINLGILLKRFKGCEKSMETLEHALKVSRGKRKAKSHALLASCLGELGEFKQALLHIDQSIQFRPNHATTWLKLAQLQVKAKLPYHTVSATYKKALALNANNTNLLLEVARFQYERLDFNATIKTIKYKYKRLKSSIKANKLLAWSYLNVGKINNARKYSKKVKSLQNRDSIFNEAFELHLNGEFEKSINTIKVLNVKSRENSYLLALNYGQRNWSQHASRQLIKLKKHSSYLYISQWRLLKNNFKERTNKELIANYESLLDDQVYGPQAAYEAAQLAKNTGLIENAVGFTLLFNDENSSPLSSQKNGRLYAELLWLKGEKVKAIDHLWLLNKEFSKGRLIKRQLANYLSTQKQFSQALDVMAQIHSANVKGSDLLLIARLLIKNDQVMPAIDNLNELLARDSKNMDARLILANLLKDKGDVNASKKQLAMLLKLDSNFQPALELLAQFP